MMPTYVLYLLEFDLAGRETFGRIKWQLLFLAATQSPVTVNFITSLFMIVQSVTEVPCVLKIGLKNGVP